MASKHPSERAQIAALAAHLKWAGTRDRTAATAAARKAFDGQFLAQAREKYGDLPDAELAIAAGHLRKAYFKNLALKSAQTRRARAAGTRKADQAEAEAVA